MYVERVPNRSSPPAILLRESYREDGRVKKRTIANLSSWPAAKIEALRAVLQGATVTATPLDQAFDVIRTRPHGHVAAVWGTVHMLALHRVLSPSRQRERDLVEAMIVERILSPRSKLATARALRAETQCSTGGEVLGVGPVDEDDLYGALDWLLGRQARIEHTLARKHLQEGTLALYDVTSTYFEGRASALAQLGYSRDGKADRPQIVVGLVCTADGCPIAVEVFPGNTGDPTTLRPQLEKLRQRFGLQRIVVVGDRGLITSARIADDLQGRDGLDWITALRAPQIQQLAADDGPLQLSLFDERDLAEITSPAFPGERLIACRNPQLAAERQRKRAELLAATETKLAAIVAATQRLRQPLRGKDRIGLRVGRVLARSTVGKHFRMAIEDDALRVERDPASIEREARLDGIYVIRTSVPTSALDSEQVVRSYKHLATVERAFRSLKSVDLKIRPIYHWTDDRIRAHVLLCMLASYVEWHMRRTLAPILFDDDDRAAAAAARASIVAPARVSARAQRKAARKRTDANEPVHSFQTLLRDLSTIAKNRVQPRAGGVPSFDVVTRPTPLQQRALDLLRVSL